MAELKFPIRDPSDELAIDLGDVVKEAVASGQLSETDAGIVRELRMRLILEGVHTCGEALERLEGLGPAGQRQWLDEARVAIGLPTVAETEQRRADRKFENEWRRLQPPPPPRWSPLQACPAVGCNAIPVDENGSPVPSDLEQYWCPEHEHLAPEGDLEKHVPAIIGLDGNYAPIYSEKEKARLAKWHHEHRETEEREREQREEYEREKAEALEAVREKFDREETVSVQGIEVHPGDVHVR